MSVLIDDLKALESAEAFLDYFDVPYDPAVVQVSRLHILKRFYQYLAQRGGLESLPAEEAYPACREMLARAYEDFVASSGVEEKVFKVFQTARGEHRVAIGGLRRAVAG